MEPSSGRNHWQPVANRKAAKTAKSSQTSERALERRAPRSQAPANERLSRVAIKSLTRASGALYRKWGKQPQVELPPHRGCRELLLRVDAGGRPEVPSPGEVVTRRTISRVLVGFRDVHADREVVGKPLLVNRLAHPAEGSRSRVPTGAEGTREAEDLHRRSLGA